jgi:hypothetical protein
MLRSIRPSTLAATNDMGAVSTGSVLDNPGASLGRLTRVASPYLTVATPGQGPVYARSEPAALRLVSPARRGWSASARFAVARVSPA